jgi:transcriptional regulator with XRE-family HTH domain
MSRLAKAVRKHGGRKAVAGKLDCSVEFVRLLLAGEKTPGLALALKIEEILRIPVSYWKDSAATRADSSDPTP